MNERLNSMKNSINNINKHIEAWEKHQASIDKHLRRMFYIEIALASLLILSGLFFIALSVATLIR